jgi:hypothetical protein
MQAVPVGHAPWSALGCLVECWLSVRQALLHGRRWHKVDLLSSSVQLWGLPGPSTATDSHHLKLQG